MKPRFKDYVFSNESIMRALSYNFKHKVIDIAVTKTARLGKRVLNVSNFNSM